MKFQGLEFLRRSLIVHAIFLIAACSSIKPPSPQPSPQHWEGRLALTVPGDALQSPQAYFAGFELDGGATQGRLNVLSPLGQILASLHWAPGLARMEKGSEVQTFASVPAMTEALLGQALPLQALFDWLEGRASPVNGWVVDVSARAEGKITAKRLQPPAELKVILTP